MNKKFSRTHFPKTQLSKLIARSGGISHYAAMESANKNIEAMRAEGDQVIMRLIAEIDGIANAPATGGQFSEADLSGILICADQIVTLAETFSHTSLNTIAKCLCDFVDGFLNAGIRDRAPVLVHVQALAMMTPGKASISDEGFQTVLGQLSKVQKHFNIEFAGDGASESLGQPAGTA